MIVPVNFISKKLPYDLSSHADPTHLVINTSYDEGFSGGGAGFKYALAAD
jgi:hypothetical protein